MRLSKKPSVQERIKKATEALAPKQTDLVAKQKAAADAKTAMNAAEQVLAISTTAIRAYRQRANLLGGAAPARLVAGFALHFPTYSTFLARPGIHLEDLFVRPAQRGQGQLVVAAALGQRQQRRRLGHSIGACTARGSRRRRLRHRR